MTKKPKEHVFAEFALEAVGNSFYSHPVIVASMSDKAQAARAVEAEEDTQCMLSLISCIAPDASSKPAPGAVQGGGRAAAMGGTLCRQRAVDTVLKLAKWSPDTFKLPQALVEAIPVQVEAMDLDSPVWICDHPEWLVGESTSGSGEPPRRMHLNALTDVYTNLRSMGLPCLRAVRSVMPVQHHIRHVQEVITFANGQVELLQQQQQNIAATGAAAAASRGSSY